jgi:hypothetical protein
VKAAAPRHRAEGCSHAALSYRQTAIDLRRLADDPAYAEDRAQLIGCAWVADAQAKHLEDMRLAYLRVAAGQDPFG